MGWHDEIEGWSGDILPFYEREVQSLPQAPIVVEVGIYRGRSLLFLAEQLCKHRPDATLYGVDPLLWDGGELWRHTLTNWMRFGNDVGNMVKLVRTTAKMAARMFDDASIDWFFIDGEHHYENVHEDLTAWMPKVKPGGLMSGHDYAGLYGTYPGVTRAVDELVGKVNVESSVWWARKP